MAQGSQKQLFNLVSFESKVGADWRDAALINNYQGQEWLFHT